LEEFVSKDSRRINHESYVKEADNNQRKEERLVRPYRFSERLCNVKSQAEGDILEVR